jgi:phosphoesterase RecJ-like protein
MILHAWEGIIKLLSETHIKNAAIVCHRNADPDALASALSVRNLILESCPSLTQVVAVAESTNQISKKIVEKYPEIAISKEISSRPDAFVLVDVNNVEHTGTFAGAIKASDGPLIVIDHHVPQTRLGARVATSLINEDASSTAEIVSLLNESIGRKPSKSEATLLLAGIIYDSRRFSRIGKDTFRAVDSLVSAGGDYQEALSVLRRMTERSEKIARLKAAQRAKLIEIGGWVVTCSNVSSFAASACRAFIDLGSDVAIVTSRKKKDVRITARSNNAFYDATKVNLAKLMEKIGVELGGHGGGHATAATVSGIGDAAQGERQIVRYIEERVRQTRVEPGNR